ncbi:MAG: type II toxin-antitoxin system PemK/MazF family toxin [Novosphingobium sp.]
MPASVYQGDIWWAALDDPVGSEAGYSRPVVIIQCDSINASRLQTYLCVPLTGSRGTGKVTVPWQMHLSASATGLDRDSIAQPAIAFAVDQSRLIERAGRIAERQLQQLFRCLDVALGREV